MKILYVPEHVQTALEAAGGSVKDLYSLQALASILSPEDVAFYCHINLDLSQILPVPLATSLPNALTADGHNPFPSDEEMAQSRALKEIMRVLNEYSLNKNAPSVNLDGMKLTCDLMDENVIRFTHIPLAEGELADNSVQGAYGLYDRVVQQLHGFYKFEDLAKLPLFAGYLQATEATLAKAA